MNATQTHFVAVCPHCSTGLKVRRVYLGQRVVCKQCSRHFMGEERDGLSTMTFGEGEAGAWTPTPPQGDRILATCPNCQATLKVRRLYIGNNVICKECERTFLVSPPVDTPSDPALDGPRQAEHDSLQVAHRELQAEHGRLAGLLKQRDTDLDAALAEQDRLRLERERALVEVERLRETFIERERAIQDECDRLRAECDRLRSGVEDLRRALEEDERTDRQELARVEAELIGLAGRNQELEGLYESTKQLCAEYQDRNQGLLEELARLRSESTARINAERSQETERVELPREDLAGLWEIADFADPSVPKPRTSSASAHEFQAVRSEVDDLKRRLTDSERLLREMAGILEGMGIRFRQV